ncbi:conserved hypothetical protein [Roseibium sp. TrichSKD4]|nr:conserved hypothetical protein [Roseibium sp. TrichSKD4]
MHPTTKAQARLPEPTIPISNGFISGKVLFPQLLGIFQTIYFEIFE